MSVSNMTLRTGRTASMRRGWKLSNGTSAFSAHMPTRPRLHIALHSLVCTAPFQGRAEKGLARIGVGGPDEVRNWGPKQRIFVLVPLCQGRWWSRSRKAGRHLMQISISAQASLFQYLQMALHRADYWGKGRQEADSMPGNS